MSYITQINLLEDFVQSLSSPSNQSSTYTSDPSSMTAEQNISDDSQNSSGPAERGESTSRPTSARGSARGSASIVHATSRSSQIVSAEAQSTSEHGQRASSPSSGSSEPGGGVEANVSQPLATANDGHTSHPDGAVQGVLDSGTVLSGVGQSDQPIAGTSSASHARRLKQSQGSGRSRSGAHWNFPAQKRSASQHTAPTGAGAGEELILSVYYDNTPALSADPLHRGSQHGDVPTILPNSVRAAKSTRSRFSKK